MIILDTHITHGSHYYTIIPVCVCVCEEQLICLTLWKSVSFYIAFYDCVVVIIIVIAMSCK